MKLNSVYIVSILFFVAAAGVGTTNIHTSQRIRAKNTVLIPGGFYGLLIMQSATSLLKLNSKEKLIEHENLCHFII